MSAIHHWAGSVLIAACFGYGIVTRPPTVDRFDPREPDSRELIVVEAPRWTPAPAVDAIVSETDPSRGGDAGFQPNTNWDGFLVAQAPQQGGGELGTEDDGWEGDPWAKPAAVDGGPPGSVPEVGLVYTGALTAVGEGEKAGLEDVGLRGTSTGATASNLPVTSNLATVGSPPTPRDDSAANTDATRASPDGPAEPGDETPAPPVDPGAKPDETPTPSDDPGAKPDETPTPSDAPTATAKNAVGPPDAMKPADEVAPVDTELDPAVGDAEGSQPKPATTPVGGAKPSVTSPWHWWAVGGVVALLLGLLPGLWALHRLRRGRPQRDSKSPAPPAPPVGSRPVAPESLWEPDYDVRIHRLLHQALMTVGWRPAGHGLAQTAREVSSGVPTDDPRRYGLDELVQVAEVVHFAGVPADAEAYRQAKQAFAAMQRQGTDAADPPGGPT